MKKKILKLFLSLIVFICVMGAVFFAYNFKEIKAVDEMFRSEGKVFGYGLWESYKYSKLMQAIWDEDTDKVDFLIVQKRYNPKEIRVRTKNGSGNLLYLYLLGRGNKANVDFVNFLISRGFAVDECVGGIGSPIFVAAMFGNIEIGKLLLENGADVNCKHKDTAVPLSVSLMFGHCDFARYLMEKGATLEGIKNKDFFDNKLKSCY